MTRITELRTIELGAAEWREWLAGHHLDSPGVWLVFRRQNSGVDSIAYSEALDGALSYGWIDSVIRKLDDQRYVRKFTPRRPGSIWSKLNIDRVRELKRRRMMTKWGLEAFERRTGEVSLLEQANAGKIAMPKEFEAALKRTSLAWTNYQKMAPSHRKRYLIWIAGAKRPKTREKRIAEAVELVANNVRNLLK